MRLLGLKMAAGIFVLASMTRIFGMLFNLEPNGLPTLVVTILGGALTGLAAHAVDYLSRPMHAERTSRHAMDNLTRRLQRFASDDYATHYDVNENAKGRSRYGTSSGSRSGSLRGRFGTGSRLGSASRGSRFGRDDDEDETEDDEGWLFGSQASRDNPFRRSSGRFGSLAGRFGNRDDDDDDFYDDDDYYFDDNDEDLDDEPPSGKIRRPRFGSGRYRSRFGYGSKDDDDIGQTPFSSNGNGHHKLNGHSNGKSAHADEGDSDDANTSSNDTSSNDASSDDTSSDEDDTPQGT